MKAHWPNGDVVVIGKQSPGITREQLDGMDKIGLEREEG
jgi:hypothetical protein